MSSRIWSTYRVLGVWGMSEPGDALVFRNARGEVEGLVLMALIARPGPRRTPLSAPASGGSDREGWALTRL